MALNYRRAEARDINDAWAHLVDAASSMDMGTGATLLRDALACERRERSSTLAARALICREVAEAIALCGDRARDLYGMARGCLLARVLGHGIRDRAPDRARNLRPVLARAVAAQRSAVARALDEAGALSHPGE